MFRFSLAQQVMLETLRCVTAAPLVALLRMPTLRATFQQPHLLWEQHTLFKEHLVHVKLLQQISTKAFWNRHFAPMKCSPKFAFQR
jgi:hypothetical protein